MILIKNLCVTCLSIRLHYANPKNKGYNETERGFGKRPR